MTSVANAIRTAGGTNSLLSFPNGFVSAVNNISGGGGDSWQTVFEGSVTTEAHGEASSWANLPELADLSADTIKVTFNSVEYTCEKQVEDEDFIIYGDDSFIECPFFISINPRLSSFNTETAGTYTVKIEVPQSGGSSDFSTAEVTFVNSDGYGVFINIPYLFKTPTDEEFIMTSYSPTVGTTVISTVLYKGLAFMQDQDQLVQSVSGSIESLGDGVYFITGDCTIIIS